MNPKGRKKLSQYILSHKIGFFFVAIGGLFLIPSFDSLSNLGAESIGIGITVLVIDFWNERRQTEQLKAQLIREMGGPSHEFALRAVRELAYHHS